MRLTIFLSQLLVAAGLTAAPLDSKTLRLIPEDARFVLGIDIGLNRHSALAEFYPFSINSLIGSVRTDALPLVQQLLVVGVDLRSEREPLYVLSGALNSLPPYDERGHLVKVLDSNTAIFGDPESVGKALLQWSGANNGPSELAAKLKSMSESYDNWFIAFRPFENVEDIPRPDSASKYRADFKQLVEEVRGGIRLGRTNELRAEATMKTADDAVAVATLSRWFPGFLQMQASAGIESALADLAENLTVISTGNTVSLSFTLDESKLADLVKVRHADQEKNRSPDDAVQ